MFFNAASISKLSFYFLLFLRANFSKNLEGGCFVIFQVTIKERPKYCSWHTKNDCPCGFCQIPDGRLTNSEEFKNFLVLVSFLG